MNIGERANSGSILYIRRVDREGYPFGSTNKGVATRSVITRPIMLVALVLTAILIVAPLLAGLMNQTGSGHMIFMAPVMALPVVIAAIILIVTLQHFGSKQDSEQKDMADTPSTLDRLQEQYVNGEISEAEFERRLEQQLEDEPEERDTSLEQRFRETER